MKFVYTFCLVFYLCMGSLQAAHIKNKEWKSGYTLLHFLNDYDIPAKLYHNLPTQDKQLADEIYAGTRFFVLLDEDDELLQALIPIGVDIQLHIKKNIDSKEPFSLSIIPIDYFISEQDAYIKITSSLSKDIYELTKDKGLMRELDLAYKNQISFSKIQKGDSVALIYERKYRLGRPSGYANLRASLIKNNKSGASYYSFSYNGNYYDINGRKNQKLSMITPVKGARITSKFSHARKHPIKGITLPHYGVDYAPQSNTSIYAASEGVIEFIGVKGGYGNVIEIAHKGGIKTLYAHMSSFAKGLKKNSYVRQGQIIGKIGSTGLSTGPHLHFGVYKNNTPVNPLTNISTRTELDPKSKQKFQKIVEIYKKDLQDIINSTNTSTHHIISIKPSWK